MRRSTFGAVLRAVAAVGLLFTAACDEDIQFVEREPFNPPPDAVAGFLGYYDAAAGFTTCGNCHADVQASWAETKHADAWATLQGSGHAQSFCEGCHTVSEGGNALEGAVGYNFLTADPAALPDSAILAVYHDVQCESCHGPGNDHAIDPVNVKPLASGYVGLALENGCGECHAGGHHPFVEQWELSAHNTGSGFSRGGIGSCNECHNGKVALVEQFGVDAKFLEKDDGEVMTHTCIVCHDPHGSPFESQLRAPLSEATPRNLCVKCHNRRTVPSQTSHGFHAAQGPLVLSDNGTGWFPDSMVWLDGLASSHGDVSVNPRLCATCHVEIVEITDAATGEFLITSVGHLFEAIPCADANGVPVGGDCTDDERRFNACAGCHGSLTASRAIYGLFKDELSDYLRSIWTDVNGNDTLDVAADTGLLVRIVQQEGGNVLLQTDTLFTVAEGILFNAQLAHTHDTPWFEEFYLPYDSAGTTLYQELGTHAASGNGVHNPPLLRALMQASIAAGASHYNLAPPAGIDLQLRPEALARKP